MQLKTTVKVALEKVPNSTCCLGSPHTFPSQDRALVHIRWRPGGTGGNRTAVKGTCLRASLLRILILPPTIWGTLGKLLFHSLPQFPHW